MKSQIGNGAILTANKPLLMKSTENVLEKIACSLLRKADFTLDMGLPYGRAGIALFLFHYYRFNSNAQYYEAAYNLLDYIYESISDPAIPTQEAILPEVGWLFMHLQRIDIIDIDADEILGDTDAFLYHKCSSGLSGPLRERFPLNIGYYLVARYNNTKIGDYKVKIAEALIHLVDEIKMRYFVEVREAAIDLLHNTGVLPMAVLCELIKLACDTGTLLAKIKNTGIYKQITGGFLSEINDDITQIVFHNSDFRNSMVCDWNAFAAFLYAIKSVCIFHEQSIGDNLEVVYQQEVNLALNELICSKTPTPYISCLIQAFFCLRSVSIKNGYFPNELLVLNEKLVNSIERKAPGYLGDSRGVPNLGLQGGLSGAGLAFLSMFEQDRIMEEDLMFLISK